MREIASRGRLSARTLASALFATITATSTPPAHAQSSGIVSNGASAGELFGTSLARVGDVNGDGVSDFVAAAPFASPGGLFAAGQVRLLSGADGATLLTVDGAIEDSLFGRALAGVGDVDGDGVPDFAVGNPLASPGGAPFAGMVTVHSGATGALLRSVAGSAPFELLGASAAGPADLDGDLVPDVLAGAYLADAGGLFAAGQVRAFSGASGALLFAVSGTGASDMFGYALAAAPDLDGDGTGDFVAGAPQDPFGPAPGTGYARVHSGASGAAMFTILGSGAGEAFGFAVDGSGDADGDGLADLVVGAPFADVGGVPDAGRAAAFSGASGASLFGWSGSDGNGGYGHAVAVAGDLDGDGRADFVVGAPLFDAGLDSDAGRIHAFSGASGAAIFDATGDAVGAFLGFAVSGAGDLDGDGRAETLVGVPGASPAGLANAGEVRAYRLDAPPDAEPPSVAILSPAAGVVVGTAGIEVAVLVGDASATTVTTAPPGLSATLPAGTGEVSGMVELVEGPNEIVVTAVDAVGNSASAAVAVVRDTIPPAVTLVSPRDGATVDGSVGIEAFVADATLASVELLVDGVVVATGSAPSLAVVHPLGNALDGAVVVTALARDAAGNASSESVTVVVDRIDLRLTPRHVPAGPANPGGGVVTAKLTGPGVALLFPPEAVGMELRVAGGPAVQAIAGSGHLQGTTLSVKFPRSAFLAALRQARSSGAAPAGEPVTVTLFAAAREIGTDQVGFGN